MRQLKLDRSITERDLDSINKYLTEIGRIPLLTIEEEINLTRRVKEGDEMALQILVRTNLRFVVSVAKKYQHRGLSLGDLINEGNLGLIRAGQRFDHTKGFKFISFAVWWIRQAIMLAIAEQTRVVRLPLNIINSIGHLNKTISALEQRLERLPTTEEVAQEVSITEQRIADYLVKGYKSVSLDAVVNTETGSTLLDIVADNSPTTDHLLKISPGYYEVERMLKRLSQREQRIIRLYFGLSGHEPLSLEHIGVLCKLSKERVRQLKDAGIKKLRSRSK